eukprot:TRINITY_DN8571_c0_g1_i1.p1 TRINITY_DN8571_c0_g1~~TRINITY_DN8571_c0_g1_i1.p1  ORF type:complete len:54 (+),score=1.34 TRINITY_DN8571_c0_g1_i1:482-643(+)
MSTSRFRGGSYRISSQSSSFSNAGHVLTDGLETKVNNFPTKHIGGIISCGYNQ